MRGLYVHIPFCIKKCDYCDFLSFPADECKKYEDDYISSLIKELESCSGTRFDTIYVGGGTPVVLSDYNLERLFCRVAELFAGENAPIEYTVEVNPGAVNPKKCTILKKYGVNRISIGLQSAHDDELVRLGRIHNRADFENSFDLLRDSGFNNINIDLISSIPGSSPERWEETLCYAVSHEPEHISAYSLIIEPGTPFFTRYDGGGSPELIDEETDRIIYRRTGEILKNAGYSRYEISNYALPGFECRHNIIYWTMGEYTGAGLGASGFDGGVRTRNTSDLSQYIGSFEDGRCIEREDRKSLTQERLFLGLRMTGGIGVSDLELLFPEFEKLSVDGLIEWSGSRIRLTERGLDLENTVDLYLYEACDRKIK